jgi:hypothetical protein
MIDNLGNEASLINSFDSLDDSFELLQNKNRVALNNNLIVVEIYNFSGILVRKQVFEAGLRPSIDISDLRKGNYILKIISKEMEEVHQIIKQ